MAPFLVRHPALSRPLGDRARDRARPRARPAGCHARPAPSISSGRLLAPAGRSRVGRPTIPCRRRASRSSPPISSGSTPTLAPALFDGPSPWDRALPLGRSMPLVEGQEMLVSLLIEPHGRPRRRPRRDHGHRRGRGLPHRWRHALRAISPRSSTAPTPGPAPSTSRNPPPTRASGTCRRRSSSPGSASAPTSRAPSCEQPLAVARDVARSARGAGASPARRDACGLPAAVARASPHRAPGADRGTPPLRRGARQPDRRRHARHRSPALQARLLRRHALRPAVGQVAAHHPVPGRALPRRAGRARLGRLDLGRRGAA